MSTHRSTFSTSQECCYTRQGPRTAPSPVGWMTELSRVRHQRLMNGDGPDPRVCRVVRGTTCELTVTGERRVVNRSRSMRPITGLPRRRFTNGWRKRGKRRTHALPSRYRATAQEARSSPGGVGAQWRVFSSSKMNHG